MNRKAKNPSGTEALVVAGGAAALFYFWPQISAMFNQPTAVAASATLPPPAAAGPFVVQQTSIPSDFIAPSAAPVLVQQPSGATYAVMTESSSAPPVAKAVTLQGTRMRGPMSAEAARAASLVQAKLNNSIVDGDPQLTNNSPIGPWTPGATQLPGGCWAYGNTPVLMNCPPGATPATPRDPANGVCMDGFTMSASGQCARQDDQAQLAMLNSTPFSGPQSLPANPISSYILAQYATTLGVNPGSILAAMLGLPANQARGTFAPGNDGFNYLMVDGVFIRQGTQTQLSRNLGPIGPRVRLQGILPSAVPVTAATLIAASSDPQIAATLGNDPRGMLTVAQWNYYYTQATGVLQVAPPFPAIDPDQLVTAQQYQAWRIQAGLTPAPARGSNLGLILNSRPGAFPLGGISNGPARVPFIQPGNHNLYRIPGRGAVSQARLGTIKDGGGDHRSARSPFPQPAWWRHAE
ncbi:MAG TPA: hypothetical protein VGH84_17435 [Steroidobacteraceae bacterium]